MSGRVLSYRRHKQSGQAVVTLPNGFGGCRDVLLGKYGTSTGRKEYARVISEWEAAGKRLPPKSAEPSAPSLSINELVLAYWRFAEDYYGFKRRRGISFNIKDALRILKEL